MSSDRNKSATGTLTFALLTTAACVLSSSGASAQDTSDTFLGAFSINWRFNAGGLFPTAHPSAIPTDGNPYYNVFIPPGPYYLDAEPGEYYVIVTKIVNGGANGRVWSGDATSGLGYYLPGPAGNRIDFTHTHGQIVLYAYDFFPWDNSENQITDVELYKVGSDDCVLEVPRYIQGYGADNQNIDEARRERIRQDAPWWNDPIGNPRENPPRNTIGRVGCALTALAMALDYAGITHGYPGIMHDPGTLQIVLENSPAFTTPGNDLLWENATKHAALVGGAEAIRFWKPADVTGLTLLPVREQLEQIVCDFGYPVILRARPHIAGLHGAHFVIVYGVQKEADEIQFLIHDPGFVDPVEHLDAMYGQYEATWEIRGFVAPSPNDRSEAVVAVASGVDEVDVSLFGPGGELTGFDPGTGEYFAEIPNSDIFRQSVEFVENDDPFIVAPPVDMSTQIPVFKPEEGIYTVEVHGREPGIYTLEITGYAADGSFQGFSQVFGISGVDSHQRFDVLFVKDIGAQPIVRRQATPEGMADDIANALQLGLISNRGIANSLTKKLEAADAAHEREQPDVAILVLDAFISEVDAQYGKHIAPQVADILLDSAETLIDDLMEEFYADLLDDGAL